MLLSFYILICLLISVSLLLFIYLSIRMSKYIKI